MLDACRFGRFRLDPAGRRLTDEKGTVVPLAGRAFDVLEYLVRHRDRVVDKEELLAAVWPHVVVEENNLNQAVSAIRRTLGDSRETSAFLATVPGRGYRFVAPLHDDRHPAEQQPVAARAEPPPPTPRSPAWYSKRYVYGAAGVAAILVAAIVVEALHRESIPAPPSAPAAARAVERPTMAVLPFRTFAGGEGDELLAQSVTELLHSRLAAFKDAVVIGGPSMTGLSHLSVHDIGQKLQARFVLQGRVGRDGERLRMDAQLLETTSGRERWSVSFNPVTDVTAVREAVAQRVAGTLQITAAPRTSDPPTSLDAYELYVQGEQLMSNLRTDDTYKAIELFRRATIIDPTFARGYLALGQAQLLANRLRSIRAKGYLSVGQARLPVARPSTANSTQEVAEARQALDRALELDPELGEIWIERASLDADPIRAEELYRKGLRLAPNYGLGYLRFSEFLYDHYRKGEAIEMIDRARQIDPVSPALHVRKAFLLMVSRSDVAGHDRLLREAIEINPHFHPALVQLAESRHEYSGEFADGIRIIEHSIAVDPQSDYGRFRAARMYLDVDDPVAAMAVVRDAQQPADPMVEIAQYRRDARHAAALARSRSGERWVLGPIAPLAEAIRDDAVITGDYASALKLLESQYRMAVPEGTERMWSRGLGLVYAHTLILAGQTQRGRELATAILFQIDSESVGRTQDWFSRERAAAFAVLGDDEKAIGELAASARTGKLYRWWYVADLDPLYEHLRSDSRFQALAERAREHRHSQRTLLDGWRQKGEVPKRDS